jgi:hypothetical protein
MLAHWHSNRRIIASRCGRRKSSFPRIINYSMP